MEGDENFHFKVSYDEPEEIEVAAPEPADFRSCTGVQPARDDAEADESSIDQLKLGSASLQEFKRLRALQQKVHQRR